MQIRDSALRIWERTGVSDDNKDDDRCILVCFDAELREISVSENMVGGKLAIHCPSLFRRKDDGI